MANVLYDKTLSYPQAGSLRELLFLLVWLKRQTIERERMTVMAQGLASTENLENLTKAFSKYEEAFLPQLKGIKSKTDKEMLAQLQKEVKSGRIMFKQLEDPMHSLRHRLKEIAAPDGLRASLAAGVKKRKGLKK